MEHRETTQEQLIWQRVFATPECRASDSLEPLLQLSAQTAADCRYLLGKTAGRLKEPLRQLLEGEQAVSATLSGVCLLSGGEPPRSRQLPPARDTAVRMLQHCYHRCRRCTVELAAREIDSECGAVFRQLKTREEAHCALITEMLGSLR